MMTQEEYKRENNALFAEWRQKYPGARFVEDGIVDPATWFADENKQTKERKPPRIVFMLKEANNMNESLCDWLLKQEDEGKRHAIWNRTAEWADALFSLDKCPQQFPPYHALSLKETTDLLRRIAVVNIKKANGIEHSDSKELEKYVKEPKNDVDLLSRQIALIDPDIIVCGYTFTLTKTALGINNKFFDQNWHNLGLYDDLGVYKGFLPKSGAQQAQKPHPTYIIDYYHPANRYPTKLSYYALAAIYQQARLNPAYD